MLSALWRIFEEISLQIRNPFNTSTSISIDKDLKSLFRLPKGILDVWIFAPKLYHLQMRITEKFEDTLGYLYSGRAQ